MGRLVGQRLPSLAPVPTERRVIFQRWFTQFGMTFPLLFRFQRNRKACGTTPPISLTCPIGDKGDIPEVVFTVWHDIFPPV